MMLPGRYWTYFCGPPIYEQAVQKMGEDFGIPDENIRFDFEDSCWFCNLLKPAIFVAGFYFSQSFCCFIEKSCI